MNTLQLLYFAISPNGTNCYSCVYFTYFCCNTGASGTYKQFPLGLIQYIVLTVQSKEF